MCTLLHCELQDYSLGPNSFCCIICYHTAAFPGKCVVVWYVVEGEKSPNPEKNGRKLNLVSTDAEFSID